MKKLLMKSIAGILAATSVFAFAACADDNGSQTGAGEKVALVPIANPADISPVLGYDYYLAAEPLASLKVKMTANMETPLHVVADLQQLYGGDKGYPQAVLVAKTSFVAENGQWVNTFMDDMQAAAEWLLADTTEISTVVSAVSANLTEGLTPSLNAKNLTKSVIENSGVWFAEATECKSEVKAFLQDLIGVSPNAAKAAADAFFYGGDSVTASSDVQAKIYMPDGAPALAMAKFMSESRAGCDFNVVDASTITTYVTGQSPAADLCVLPLNAASKLLGTGEKYTMLGTVTHGNLYLLSTSEETIDSAEELKSLAGKKVGTIQINNVPGLTLKLLLKNNGVEYTETVIG